MGKKGVKGGGATNDKEGKNLLGQPTFKELENGRFKCVEMGHAKDSYANTKHYRLSLIDAAVARNQPPDPLSTCSSPTPSPGASRTTIEDGKDDAKELSKRTK
ncbi:uncharacterized protein LOC130775458 isoform X2 [Actinidia eriantha]|uniref:uncharacterized protein LOC130775458 isoform X2 n=1 Tax=Actinidia eriantha TaxID=165200 RepID=UPI0025885CA8|nr:uncharacterized protein LOC130775458 isoform X2 [Actinidia eriantha]